MKHLKSINEMLKVKTKKMIEVQDWDNLVEKTYGKPYSFQQQDGCKSRGIYKLVVPSDGDDYERDDVDVHEMGVSFNSWVSTEYKNPKKDYKLVLFWKRRFYPSVESIANDLFKRGLIEEGEYIINIDW
jgi:hypothetical protein